MGRFYRKYNIQAIIKQTQFLHCHAIVIIVMKFKTRPNWSRKVRDMNMSTMSMSGRDRVA